MRPGTTGHYKLRDHVQEKNSQFWPTPRSGKTTNENEATWRKRNLEGKVATPPLSLAVRMWPTPREGSEERYESRARRKGHNVAMSYLESAVDWVENFAPEMWPTPRASEYKDTGPVGSKSHKHMDARDYLCAKVKDPKQPNGSLNPTWVEWLMGYPTGFTVLKDWATPSSRRSRPKSSDASGK